MSQTEKAEGILVETFMKDETVAIIEPPDWAETFRLEVLTKDGGFVKYIEIDLSGFDLAFYHPCLIFKATWSAESSEPVPVTD